ncbi:5-carboxymethyl-2-hydroxymuconate isomerase [Ferrimonas balearica DSM 9799]|uniref:5-carboxymethyl-2-hydroxymuconate isomerase n=1 Tax=Ferrimonas balearica (strain DSM 9799 / CCM 4581 / KCTC 23876 / PAT) TaxID=550540 RepID=E1STW4_FERBD|nr:5-carboxymethyl-2-hydroxymuconate Delta-isomerase [Ferrimonas balearica]MBY6017711.1 5-carboxymethyl-2-hydroxymuconate Delta-isomerase [Halomonas denitrificans]ADN77208.1 5-carboxymethyl-2-hydroxymuconate isomerase [Ferrimonas balearica DSM 9799]MBW3139798.1 5-carboxymethyl-2-hydroxymuconate Delta-isomerase [Ferrimonas balearica]MBW3164820.1 5-carboxymethyl-2-hydroxymuconate Delta-isomerase [Ferrimonas balearica]MBY5980314.1 5-carboxymethyl-2-hydroxymuconate Delta-isomerase [Ferrimonas bale
MPHLVLEYNEYLINDDALPGILTELHNSALASGEFSAGAIKVRALPVRQALVGGEPAPFAHLTLAILPGRNDATKDALSERLLETLHSVLPPVAAASVEIAELNHYRKWTAAD